MFPRTCAAISLLLLLACGCHKAPGGETGPAAPYEDAARSLTAALSWEVEDKQIPAAAIVLVDDQQVVWSRGFGSAHLSEPADATPETVFRVGSVSKLFTDLAVMQLVERGELDLDAPVTGYLPEFHPRNPFSKPITLRHLMTHRSGLVREPPAGNYFDDSGPTLAATVASLNETTLVYEPGARTKYSNAGIAVAGYLLETRQRQPFPSYVRDRILVPGGMGNSAFQPTPAIQARLAQARMWSYDHRLFPAPTFELGMSPAGSLYSSAADLGRFLALLFAGGKASGGRIVKPETLAQMYEPQFSSSGYGLGFALGELGGFRTIGHGGAIYGFATQLLAVPSEKLGVAVIASLDGANSVTSRLARFALLEMLHARKKVDAPGAYPQSVRPAASFSREFAGLYEGAGRTIRFVEEDGEVYLFDRDRKARVRAAGDQLVVDDRHAYEPMVERLESPATLRIEGEIFHRIPDPLPKAASEALRPLIGQYGPDYNELYILEEDGRLYALIEWFFRYPLTETAKDTFAFPDRGLYPGESLVFHRDANGNPDGVTAAGIWFPRRKNHPGNGETFHIQPVRPVRDLRTEAAGARPPRETGNLRPAELVDLAQLDPSLKFDIRYAGPNNFLGEPVYSSARAFLQRPAAEALLRAHRSLAGDGYGLLIHDAYRPWSVTKIFWDATPDSMKDFVANPANGSRHNRGCAVDLTLYDRRTGEPVEMASGYDEFSDRAFPYFPGGTARQRWLRRKLRSAMEAEGFTVYQFEWWHFDYRDWKQYGLGNQSFEQLSAR